MAEERGIDMRNIKIDLLRTIAIIAVVLYHMGYQPYGYLGVDVFFVISGYFLMKGYLKEKNRDTATGKCSFSVWRGCGRWL